MRTLENELDIPLFQNVQSAGRLWGSVDATSAANKWVTLCRVEVLKTRSIVCLSERPDRTFAAAEAAALTRSW